MRASDIPNIISIFRILLTFPVVWMLLHERYGFALWLFAVAGVSDGLDGYLAKRYGWISQFGAVLDPLADKFLLVCVYLALGWQDVLPLWLVVLVLGRDLLIVLGASAYYQLLGRYEMSPSLLSKLNTFVQIILVLVVVIERGTLPVPARLNDFLFYLVAVTTLASGMHYVWVWSLRAIQAYQKRAEMKHSPPK